MTDPSRKLEARSCEVGDKIYFPSPEIGRFGGAINFAAKRVAGRLDFVPQILGDCEMPRNMRRLHFTMIFKLVGARRCMYNVLLEINAGIAIFLLAGWRLQVNQITVIFEVSELALNFPCVCSFLTIKFR
jgi:hypothetical protein